MGQSGGRDETPIEMLDLGVRTFNAVKRTRLDTVADIERWDREVIGGIRRIANVGVKGEQEIRDALAKGPVNTPRRRRVIALERNRAIYEARQAGEGWAAIGRRFEISPERVRQIVHRMERT
jgi:hypothetical protein